MAARPARLHPALRRYLPAAAMPVVLSAVVAGTGVALAATPPPVPVAWHYGGLGLLALAAILLAGLLAWRARRRLRLERATRLLARAVDAEMRLTVETHGRRAYADLMPVGRAGASCLAAWPPAPRARRADRPVWRVSVYAPGKGFMPPDKQTIQAEVRVDPDDPRLVVIQTRQGILVSFPGANRSSVAVESAPEAGS